LFNKDCEVSLLLIYCIVYCIWTLVIAPLPDS